METCSERRKRKLIALAEEKGGLKSLAADCDLSYATLDQIIKGVLLPRKADGTRSERALGDDTARLIETRYGLERGWFDSDDSVAAAVPSLEVALRVLAEALQASSKHARLAVAPLLSAMAAEPAEAKNQSELILKLLVTERDKLSAPVDDVLGTPHLIMKKRRVKIRDAEGNNGRRNPTAAKSGGTK